MDHSSRTAFDQAYAAPQQAVGRAPGLAALRVRSAKLLGASTATFALSIGVLFLTNGARAGGLVFLVAAGLAAVGAGYGVAAVARGASAGVGAGGILTALGLTAVNL
ncbi:MAG TPA: hypothetical protein VLT33_23135, partial [Labilithrix sp.]|nr:hypothetical protein [Labilithrix sp.]